MPGGGSSHVWEQCRPPGLNGAAEAPRVPGTRPRPPSRLHGPRRPAQTELPRILGTGEDKRRCYRGRKLALSEPFVLLRWRPDHSSGPDTHRLRLWLERASFINFAITSVPGRSFLHCKLVSLSLHVRRAATSGGRRVGTRVKGSGNRLSP